MDMPATQRGVDLYPDREPSVDFRAYSARVREFGVALKPGDRIITGGAYGLPDTATVKIIK